MTPCSAHAPSPQPYPHSHTVHAQVQWQLSSGKRGYLPRLGGPLNGISPSTSQPGRYLVSQTDNCVRVVNVAAARVECSVHGLRPPPVLPPSLAASGAGAVAALHPGTGQLVLAGANASLQFFDAARDAHAGRMQVAPRNFVSTTDAGARGGIYGPPTEPQVLCLAFSADGGAMATVDVRPDGGAGGSVEPCLRFWERPAAAGSGSGGAVAGAAPYALNTRVDDPHAGLVTGLAFHPSRAMAATCSTDGEFKLWVRGRTPGAAGTNASSSGCWRCASVGSYKRQPLGGCTFSGDGSLLAVAAGGGVTLWRPQTNALVAALVAPPATGGAPVNRLAFLTGSPHLVGTTGGPHPHLVVWDLLSAAPAWVLPLPATALAADPAAPRFAVGVPAGATGPGAPGGVLVFGAGEPAPRSACRVPGGSSPAALLYAPRGSALAAQAGSDGGSALLMVTSDRHFALLGGGSDVAAAAGSTGAAAAGEAEQGEGAQAGSGAHDDVFGKARARGAAAAAVAGGVSEQFGDAAQRAVAALFDAPSHVLPPPSALMPSLLELLVSGQPAA